MAKTIAAGIFIVRKDKKLLVCHPTNHKADFWSIPKGKADEGEDMITCALRETYEETNIDLCMRINPFYRVYELEPVNYGHKKKMLFPFLYWEMDESDTDWDNLEIKCNSNVPLDRGGFPEMDEYKWVDIEEARPILHETQSACLDKIKSIIYGN